MADKKKNTDKAREKADIRSDAERLLREGGKGMPTATDPRQVLHELQVHQIELEMQNEELRRAQTELEASRSEYAELYDFAPVGYFVMDRNGVIIGANLTVAAMMGVERSEMVSKPLSVFVAKESQDEFYKHRRIVFEECARAVCELKVMKKDKSPMHVSLETCRIEDGSGTEVHCRTAMSDITDRKEAEAALRQSERMFHSLSRLSPVGMFRTNSAGDCLYVNERWCRIARRSADLAIGQRWMNWIYPEDRQRVATEWDRAAQQRRSFRMEYRLQALDGTTAWVLGQSEHDIGPQGEIIGYVGTITDISERRLAEEAVRESEASMRAITDSAHNAMIMMDPQGRISYWNPAAETVFGYTSAEAIGQNLHGLIAPERYLAAFQSGFSSFQESGHGAAVGKTLELEGRRKDGQEIQVELSLSAVKIKDSYHAVGIVRDITERKLMERLLYVRERQLSDAMDMANLTYWEYDVKEDIFTFNNCFYESHGTTAEQEGGFSMSSETYVRRFVHIDDAQIIAGEIAMGMASNEPDYTGQLTHRIVRKDGQERVMAVLFNMRRDVLGHPVSFHGTSQNITDRKKAEAELRWKTTFLEAQVEASLDGLLVVDDKAQRILANKRMFDIWKVPQHIVDDKNDELLLAHNLSMVKYPDQFIERVRYLYAHPDETSRDEIELKDGRVLDRYSSPVYDKDGKYFGRIWTFRDISDRKQTG